MREVPKFRTYLDKPHVELWQILADVCNEIAGLSVEIGICEGDQLRGRADAYMRSEHSSATGRNQEADVATSTVASTLVELYADRNSYVEEKFFIVRLLDA